MRTVAWRSESLESNILAPDFAQVRFPNFDIKKARRQIMLANFAIAARLAAIRGEATMPTRNISLTPEQDAFIKKAVK